MGNGNLYLSLQQTFTTAISYVIQTLIGFIPQLVVGIVILLTGFLIGNWLKKLTKNILNAINFSSLTKNSTVEKFLVKADIKLKIEEIIGETIRLIVIYIFLIAAINTLGLVTVSQFLSNILNYIPNIVSAVFILTIGIIAAGFVENLIKGAIVPLDVATGRLMGKISSYTVIVFASLIAIGELGIAQSFINTLFTGFVAMLAIGLGLAFGLGAKEIVSEILQNWYRNLRQEIKQGKRTPQ